jgi:hypothetical protein
MEKEAAVRDSPWCIAAKSHSAWSVFAAAKDYSANSKNSMPEVEVCPE